MLQTHSGAHAHNAAPQQHQVSSDLSSSSNGGNNGGNGDSTGAARAGSSPPPHAMTLSDRLELVSKRFLHDIVSWTSLEDFRPLSAEEVERAACIYLAPGAVIHVDGLLGALVPSTMTGEDAFFDFVRRERAAYRPLAVEPLVVAVNEEQDTAFLLSAFRVEHCGAWLGRAPTGRVSEGVRIDELRFDSEAKIVEAWCNRQLYQEEREVLLREPDHHHAAILDRTLLRQTVSEHERRHGGPLSPHKMMQVATLWTQSWNVATASGRVNPDMLDQLAEEGLALYDLVGLTGDDAQHPQHPYTSIRSRSDAKRVLLELTDRYDVDEAVVRLAAAGGTNAVFSHWRATLTQRTPEAVTADVSTTEPGPVASGGGSGDGGGAAAAAPVSYVAEATDLLLFSPCGKLQAIMQFRRPLGSDRRAVLSAEGEATAMAEAGMAEAAGVKGVATDLAPEGAPEGIVA